MVKKPSDGIWIVSRTISSNH